MQGASGGIGAEFAKQLAARGEHVVACSRAPEECAALVELRDAHPGTVSLLALDATDEASVVAAATRVAKEHGGAIDSLLNTGGLLHDPAIGLRPETALSQLNADAAQRVFAVNCVAPMLTLKHFAPLLQAGGTERDAERGPALAATLSARVGSIGDNKLGGWYSYRASKSALNQMLTCAALELRRDARTSKGKKRHVACVALHPGTVATPLSAPWHRNVRPEKLFTREDAVRDMLAVLDGLDAERDNGRFLDYSGAEIVW